MEWRSSGRRAPASKVDTSSDHEAECCPECGECFLAEEGVGAIRRDGDEPEEQEGSGDEAERGQEQPEDWLATQEANEAASLADVAPLVGGAFVVVHETFTDGFEIASLAQQMDFKTNGSALPETPWHQSVCCVCLRSENPKEHN